MRSVWQHHKRVAYVVSGSRRSALSNIVLAPNAPFFQHFDLMDIGSLSPADAATLLVECSRDAVPIPAETAASLVQTFGGHPFYLQLAGEAVSSGPAEADPASVKAILQSLVFSRTGRLALYFQNVFDRLVGNSSTLAATLVALSAGPRPLGELASAINASPASTLKYLARLEDAVSAPEGGRYALADPVFAIWLRWRSPGGAVVPMSVLGDEAEEAVAAQLAKMGFELVYKSRASRGAFDLLALRGTVQLGVQVKRRPLPLTFTRSEWQRMAADARRFGWSWIVAANARSETHLLDPARARKGKQIRLTEDAVIDNLLHWLEQSLPSSQG